MFNTTTIIVIYALIVGIGGVMGFIKSASMISLIAGISSAAALLLSAIAVYAKKKWGIYIAFGIGGLLLITFVLRYLKTRSMMPSGLMILLSIVFLIALISRSKKKIDVQNS